MTRSLDIIMVDRGIGGSANEALRSGAGTAPSGPIDDSPAQLVAGRIASTRSSWWPPR